MVCVVGAYLLFPQFRTLDGAIQTQRADRDREAAAFGVPAEAAGG